MKQKPWGSGASVFVPLIPGKWKRTSDMVRIARYLAVVQPYARNGNVGQRRPRCHFEAQVDGRPVSSRTTLKNALAIAREFDPAVTKACVFDPEPIPEKV